MAKVLFTAVVADMRNKLNGTVFSKNRYGAYTRTKVTPVNPQTTAQQLVRSRFGSRSSAWRSLTEAQRQTWIDAAPSFPVFDIFGNQKILSGQALYEQLNLNLTLIGETALESAPAAASVGNVVLDGITADFGSENILLQSATANVPANLTAVVEGTPYYSPGISFVKNKYRFVQLIEGTGGFNGANVYSAWSDVFGTLLEGQKVSIRVKFINTSTGQASVASSATAIITD